MMWIDVNKSLPGYGERVMLCVEDAHGPRQAKFGSRMSTSARGEIYDTSGEVTHWSPEPELPVSK